MTRAMRISLAVALAALAAVGVRAWATPATLPAEVNEDLQVRIYEVGPLAEQLAAQAGNRGKPVDPVRDIEDLILRTVEPLSWGPTGGNGNIKIIGSRLVIRQTPSAHEQIMALLEHLMPPQANLERVLHYQFQGPVVFPNTLGEVLENLDELASQFGANIMVDWNTFSMYGIGPDTEVKTPALQNVRFVTVLDLLLEQVSSTLGDLTEFGWQPRENILYISTRDRLARRAEPMTEQQRAREAETQIGLVDRMKDTYADPIAAGIVAIGAIKAELQRNGQDVVQGLEGLLQSIRAQGLRNALHMTLRDLYAQQGNQAKVMEHLTQMLRENDTSYVDQLRSGMLGPGFGGYDRGGRGQDPGRGSGRGMTPLGSERVMDPQQDGTR